MRFPVLLAVLSILPAGLAAQAPDAAPSIPVETIELAAFEPTREEAVLEAYIDGIIAAYMREHDTPGVTLSVVSHGRVLFAKGYGVVDAQGQIPANGQETLFRIGSISKTFIWTAVMMLAEQNLIDLDADVNQYLKGVTIPDAFGAPITMNHLMAHRAGFENTIGVFTHTDDSELSLTEALNRDMPKRVFAPGARTSYSNWGAALAAKIVEDVSGVSFETFIKIEMLGPLAMSQTTLAGPTKMNASLREHLAAGLTVEGGGVKDAAYMQIGPYAPVGAIASTAQDMSQWMLIHLGRGAFNGVRLMSKKSHEILWSRRFNDRPDGADVAHGFLTKTYRGVEFYGHGGATNAFYSNMVLYPELELGVFISQNSTDDRTLVSTIPDLIIDRLTGGWTGADLQPADVSSQTLAEYAGTYLNNRRSFTKFDKLFAVSVTAQISVDEKGALFVETQGKVRNYAPLAGKADVFEDRYGNRIIFGRNDNGAVTFFTDASSVHSYERVNTTQNPATLNLALGLAILFSITTWAGAWRRQSRPVSHNAMGVLLNRMSFGVAGLVFAFVGTMVWMMLDLAAFSVADLPAYPSLSVTVMRGFALVVVAAAFASLVSLWPAWVRSGWSFWRKSHYTVFALSLGGLALMLVIWNVVFSSTG
jgi:CubicO group peptidase (beta-lactamase class C family)